MWFKWEIAWPEFNFTVLNRLHNLWQTLWVVKNWQASSLTCKTDIIPKADQLISNLVKVLKVVTMWFLNEKYSDRCTSFLLAKIHKSTLLRSLFSLLRSLKSSLCWVGINVAENTTTLFILIHPPSFPANFSAPLQGSTV